MRAFAALIVFSATAASAQDPSPVYQKPETFRFTLEGVARAEWTSDIFVSPSETRSEDRYLGWALPGAELNFGKFEFGAVGGFYYADEENYEPVPAVQRDNFRSRDARLDQAYGRFTASWIKVEGGRFEMPIGFTEMIWDKELRPQGGALELSLRDQGALSRLGLTALYAKGSHVFDDKTEMLVASVEARLATGADNSTQLVGSYVEFRDTETLAPFLRRQNTRVPGGADLRHEYRVLDGVIRTRRGGQMPLVLVANYCWNTARDEENKGLWLAASLGSVETSRARLDYTYASVDRDATLGAYAADDFFWTTGWSGHRGDFGFRVAQKASLHGVVQYQRFKDSARVEEREHWVKRYRVELRVHK
jgi:hypothetical protein